MKYAQYQLIDCVLFQQNYDNVLLRWLERDDANKVLAELHDKPTIKHFREETTTHKVLRVRYYWPKLFKHAHAYARTCQVFQVNMGKERQLAFPLEPVTIEILLNNGD